MIAYLNGFIIARWPNHIILDVNGVGYKVAITGEHMDALAAISPEEKVRFWIHHVVREDAQHLYGFLDEATLSFFELLITISGIGPKTALSILNTASVKTLRQAIASGDATRLTKVSGIGKKNAEKMVLELKDKLADESFDDASHDDSDTLEALKAIGYSEKEAREALKQVPHTITDTSKRLKEALKFLGK
jgi:Holliday junction DNA helicase RuvA